MLAKRKLVDNRYRVRFKYCCIIVICVYNNDAMIDLNSVAEHVVDCSHIVSSQISGITLEPRVETNLKSQSKHGATRKTYN